MLYQDLGFSHTLHAPGRFCPLPFLTTDILTSMARTVPAPEPAGVNLEFSVNFSGEVSVQGFVCQVLDSGFRVWSFRFRVSGSVCIHGSGLWFMASVFGFIVKS